MPYTPVELEALVRKRAPEIAKGIREAADRSRSEADLVAEVESVLRRFAENFELSLHPEHERSLVTGRADAVYNRFVVEYEPPGTLRKERDAGPNRHAVEQVKRYMAGLAEEGRHRKERLAGAVLDGSYFIFVRYRDGHWWVDDPVPVTPHSTETFLRYLLSLSTELALTPENLVRDFGEDTEASRLTVSALYHALCASIHPRVQTLFQQWQRMFREICGYEEGSTRLDVERLAESYGVRSADGINPLHLFFAIHTYYALFIKLLAVQIAHYYLMPKIGTGLAQVASEDSRRLQAYLRKMERGGILADFGIKNFLEGDFFAWYLDVWNDDVEQALRRIIGGLAHYSLVSLDVDPEETRDLLKQLYQNLMPRRLRHDLGEYYTPDWLAERVLNQLGVDGDPRKRLLDPACGSGTFLVLTIKRIRKYAEDKMLPEADVLEQILRNVVGFDLNPLAVISARTNYLLALGDLLAFRRGETSIPVYLADSILTPTMEKTETGQLAFIGSVESEVRSPGYSFNTAVGRFAVPEALVDARYIDRLADLLEECVGSGLTTEQFVERLRRTFSADVPLDKQELETARALYERLRELDRQGINGIWARIIKNAFAPLFQGRFDYIAGNPPWVNWESLPDDYRQETKALWVYHGLFPHGGMDTILGKGKKDISMLMTYVAVDKYLGNGGKLGFLITQSVFKTAGAGQGFRRFRLGDGTPIAVVHVDDMAELKPFEGAANRTAIVILQKGRPTKYPVPYTYWRKKGGGAVIPEDVSLEEAEAATVRRSFSAQPVDAGDPTSSWITGRARALQAVGKILGASDYQAKAGVCTWLNSVYWVEILGQRPDGLVVVRNITEGAKREVEQVEAILEPDLLYPLLRGRDVRRWQARPSAYILMVQDSQKRRGYDAGWLAVQYPMTYAYLKQFEDVLRRRSGFQRYFRKTDPFYSMFDVGDYTFAPYKVVWRGEVAPMLVASVVAEHGNRIIIPDQTVYFIGINSETEAHYLCAVLNSLPVRGYYQMRGYKHVSMEFVKSLAIPAFQPTCPVHCRLSALSQEAHAAAGAGDDDRVREIEAQIDALAAQLWGLTEEELREIQRSLAELG